MVWVLLITMIIRLLSPQEIFTVPKLKKEIKTHVAEDARKDSLLVAYKESKKVNKVFLKSSNKNRKRIKKLMKSNNNELENIRSILDEDFEKRRELQAFNIEKRLLFQDLMLPEEWEKVIENVVSPSQKMEKKAKKTESKLDDAIDKVMQDTKRSIQKNIQDEAQMKVLLDAFGNFQKALKLQVKEGLKIDFQREEVARNQGATRVELQDFYKRQNNYRESVYDEFLGLYELVYANTNANERKAVRKELNRLFK